MNLLNDLLLTLAYNKNVYSVFVLLKKIKYKKII